MKHYHVIKVPFEQRLLEAMGRYGGLVTLETKNENLKIEQKETIYEAVGGSKDYVG